jgi:hypothetical protein
MMAVLAYGLANLEQPLPREIHLPFNIQQLSLIDLMNDKW